MSKDIKKVVEIKPDIEDIPPVEPKKDEPIEISEEKKGEVNE